MPRAIRTSGERRALLWLAASLGSWGLYLTWLWPRMLFERSDGLWAGWRTVWADWAAHFAYANVFAYRDARDWFTVHPLFATRSFDYPPVVDALSGLLMRAGLERSEAFLWPSAAASLLLVGLLHHFYARRLDSPALAFLASSLFFTNGGMGFLRFARDLAREPSLPLLQVPPREYTWLPQHHVEWINVVSSELLPQRAILLGLPLALALLLALGGREGLAAASRARLAVLGLLAGLLPVVHPHSWLVLVVLCALLCLFDLRHLRAWLGFAAAAALPSLLFAALLYGSGGEQRAAAWHPGWLSRAEHGGGMPFALFLWLNWGVFLPLAVVAVVRLRSWRDPLVLGAIALFVASFLVKFQPNAWDNTKILTWAHLLLCMPVAAYLAHLAARRSLLARGSAALLVVFVMASGILDLWRLTRTSDVAVRMWSREEMQLADSFRRLSDPSSRVLCSDHHHHWVTSLSGRPVLLGYRGWLASYGIDTAEVERDVQAMLSGAPGAEELLTRYGVEYVVIGPSERQDFGAAEEWFARRHELVLEAAKHKVFRVAQPPRKDAS